MFPLLWRRTKDQMVLMPMAVIDQMKTAFEEVATHLTGVLRDAKIITGRLATQEEHLRKLIMTVDRIKTVATKPYN